MNSGQFGIRRRTRSPRSIPAARSPLASRFTCFCSVAVGDDLVLVVDRRPAGAPAVGVGVEELRGHVEPDRVARLREREHPLRPERPRRETFLDRDRHRGPPVRSQTPARRHGSQLHVGEQPIAVASRGCPVPALRAGLRGASARTPRARLAAAPRRCGWPPGSARAMRRGSRRSTWRPRSSPSARGRAPPSAPGRASGASTWGAGRRSSPASWAARSGPPGASSGSTRARRCWRRLAPGSPARVSRTAWRSGRATRPGSTSRPPRSTSSRPSRSTSTSPTWRARWRRRPASCAPAAASRSSIPTGTRASGSRPTAIGIAA